jgi:hypothetical protein
MYNVKIHRAKNQNDPDYNNNFNRNINSHRYSHNLLYFIKIFMIQYVDYPKCLIKPETCIISYAKIKIILNISVNNSMLIIVVVY